MATSGDHVMVTRGVHRITCKTALAIRLAMRIWPRNNSSRSGERIHQKPKKLLNDINFWRFLKGMFEFRFVNFGLICLLYQINVKGVRRSDKNLFQISKFNSYYTYIFLDSTFWLDSALKSYSGNQWIQRMRIYRGCWLAVAPCILRRVLANTRYACTIFNDINKRNLSLSLIDTAMKFLYTTYSVI